MSERRCVCELMGVLGDCICGALEPQEGGDDGSKAGSPSLRKEPSLLPPCDSPELAAIRAKIPAMATADSGWPEVHALINMVDELTAVNRGDSERLSAAWKREDDLRAKLAEQEADYEKSRKLMWEQARELEAKLVEAEKQYALLTEVWQESRALGVESEKKVENIELECQGWRHKCRLYCEEIEVAKSVRDDALNDRDAANEAAKEWMVKVEAAEARVRELERELGRLNRHAH